MSTPLRVLIVEDSEDDALLNLRALKSGGYEPTHQRVETAEEMTAALHSQTWDLVLSDYSLPHFSAPEALRTLQASRLDLPFIVVTGTVGEERAAEIIRNGAQDFILKDNLPRLAPIVTRELREATMRQEKRQMENALRQATLDLSIQVEELNVAQEELRQQNEELVAAQLSLDEERARYQSLFEFAPDGYLVTDEEGNIQEANRAAVRMFNVEPRFLTGKPLATFVTETEHLKFISWLTQLRKDEAARLQKLEVAIQPRQQPVFPAEVAVAVISNERGALTGYRWLVRDVAERRRAEETPRVSEERFAKAFRASPDVLVISRQADGKIIEVNDSWSKTLGYTREESVGRTSLELGLFADPEDRRRAIQLLQAQASGGGITGE
jgi:PAS domain S-box-containing protein